jgi:pyruvate dehydrogenase E2 component (dihydrolipoamide acetyltransferase)
MADANKENSVFYLPDLGEGLDEAELIEWSVDVGQSVAENDILAKMETAKALVEIPSPRAGVIGILHGKPGQAIKVGAPLVTFKSAKPAPRPAPAPTPEPQPRSDAGTVVGNLGQAETPPPGQVLAAPAVRHLARDMGVDLATIAGTGVGGRITAEDVRSAVRDGAPAPRALGAPASPGRADAQHIPFRGVRRTIAEHLRYSVSHAVHFTVMDEADVTELDALRRKLVASSNEKITLLPFVAFAVCRVLTGDHGDRFARLNSTVDDEKQEIIQHRAVHLGIATDTESGLMVPVIRDADRLGAIEISRQIAALARSARDRTLTPQQLTGSTFTISNFGGMGGRFGTPIINYPESGILAIGRAREGVIVRHGMLGVGKLLPLSLSADHRVIDGAAAAAALARVVELLQSPQELLATNQE